jgi:hypothetical protein
MKKPIAVLDQFKEKGRTITYMTSFEKSHNDGRMPQSIAVFKIYLKERKKTFFESIFPFVFKKRMWNWANNHLIANQIHP